ncbi:hypothetical protein EYF80_003986 [Liparis tanakae]|uniref:Uncharacterized protein n=1 Tax=Liparis tanakae TaxID=230148 RepID=A0A4Z2J6B4_9TELE|nr:hypothetical protein EYF80_003986 [Liparis tanakae]
MSRDKREREGGRHTDKDMNETERAKVSEDGEDLLIMGTHHHNRAAIKSDTDGTKTGRSYGTEAPGAGRKEEREQEGVEIKVYEDDCVCYSSRTTECFITKPSYSI